MDGGLKARLNILPVFANVQNLPEFLLGHRGQCIKKTLEQGKANKIFQSSQIDFHTFNIFFLRLTFWVLAYFEFNSKSILRQ